MNEAENVSFEHGFNVILSNVADVLNTKDEARVVDYRLHVKLSLWTAMLGGLTENVDVTEIGRHLVQKTVDLFAVRHVEWDRDKLASLLQPGCLMGSRALCLDLSKGLCTSGQQDNIRSTLFTRLLGDFSVIERSSLYLGEEDSGGLPNIKSDPDASKSYTADLQLQYRC